MLKYNFVSLYNSKLQNSACFDLKVFVDYINA